MEIEKASGKRNVNLFITMLLGGLWHGAAIKFVVWGALHGVGLAIHRVWSKFFNLGTTRFGKIVSVLITFHFVAFCWMYFRAADINTVWVMLENIANNFGVEEIVSRVSAYWRVFVLMLLGYGVHLLPSNLKNRVQGWFTAAPFVVKIILFVLLIVVVYQATSADIQPFIYFQF